MSATSKTPNHLRILMVFVFVYRNLGVDVAVAKALQSQSFLGHHRSRTIKKRHGAPLLTRLYKPELV